MPTRVANAIEPGGLPAPGTKFVARAEDLDALMARFAEGARLVTLMGPGGVGKTRLAIEFATRLSAPRDGITACRFCDLSGAGDRDGLLLAVAGAMGVMVRCDASDAALMQIAVALRAHGSLLLVLDNFEQLTSVGATFVARWLAMVPSLRVLVTSRERLRVSGEQLHEVAPLSTRGEAGGDAVALFVDRARAVCAGYSPAKDELAILVTIAARLDGLPLAIELAAARMKTLGADAVLRRLDDRFTLLAGDARDVATRHLTLRAAIDWSWELLDPCERDVLAQASVFRGGFSMAAARAVIDLAEHPSPPPVEAVLDSLQEKSLLTVQTAPALGGEPWFGFLASIEMYAAEKLAASGRLEPTRRRHAEYFAAAMEALANELNDSGDMRRLARMEIERGNVLAVVERARALVPASRAWIACVARVSNALESFQAFSIPTPRFIALFDDMIAAAETTDLEPGALGWFFKIRGNQRRVEGDLSGGRADIERSIVLARAAGEHRLENRWAVPLAALCLQEGRVEDAIAITTRVAASARSTGDNAWEPLAMLVLGRALRAGGRLDEAEVCYERAIARCHTVGNPLREAQLCNDLARLLIDRERHDAARHWAERSLALQTHGPQSALRADSEGIFGWILQVMGDLEPAAMVFARIVAIEELHGRGRPEHVRLGMIRLEQGRLDEARVEFEAVMTEASARSERGLARAYAALAIARSGAHEEAHALLRDPDPRGASSDDVTALHAATRIIETTAMIHCIRDAAEREAYRSTLDRSIAAASAPEAHASAELRVAVRIAKRHIETVSPPLARPEAPRENALEVHREGLWFRAPGGEIANCARRRVLGVLLIALSRARESSPASAVSVAELIEAAWPADRSPLAYKKNRLNFALSELRTLGLRDVLLTAGAGYLIDPATVIVWKSEVTDVARAAKRTEGARARMRKR